MTTAGYNEAALTKYGFLTGVGLLVIGTLGETLLPVFTGPLPDWENVLFTDFMILGIVVAMVSVFVFGIYLPLTR